MQQNHCSYATNGCVIAEKYEKKKRHRGIRIIGGILIISLLLGIFASAGGTGTPSENYIAVLNIEGTISENDGYTYDQ